ncbi:MAG: type II CAAX endopeptidase family protein [Tissierellia bacterium]|nr:type II CAAX endopeptidase family protein [Tissierellia bacterium]
MEHYISQEPIHQARRKNSRMGLSLCIIGVLAMCLSTLCTMVLPSIFLMDGKANMEELVKAKPWILWMIGFFPLYIAAPFGIYLMRKTPSTKIEEHALGLGKLLMYFVMCVPILFLGSIISNVIQKLVSGTEAINPLEHVANQGYLVKTLFLVIIAPVLEEFIFRKTIIDRTVQYGEKMAIFFSGLTFGLFHINLSQFFFAFGLGLFFAYIYVRTGRLRYVIILHIAVNFMGTILAPMTMSKVHPDELNSFMENIAQGLKGPLPEGIQPFLYYLIYFFSMVAIGTVLWIIQRKNFHLQETEQQVPKGQRLKVMFGNVGVPLFLIYSLTFIIRSIILAMH